MDEIAQIGLQIQGIGDQTQKLLEQQTLLLKQRNHLCTRLNSLQSVICTIPVEILAHIFHFLIPYRGTHIARTLIRIGAVCTHWRHTAWSAPQLWAEIQLLPRSLNTQESRSRDVTPLLRLYYQNSGGLPVDFTLDSLRTTWCPSQSQAEELMQTVLRKYGHRLRSLTIIPLSTSITKPLLELACSDIQLPFLEDVQLSWSTSPDFNEHQVAFRRAPRLSRLSITLSLDARSFVWDFPWRQLNVLQLHDIHPSRALDILASCTQLVKFDFRCGWGQNNLENGPTITNAPLTLTRLQRLAWIIQDQFEQRPWGADDDSPLLINFRFPSLNELTRDGVLDIVNSEQGIDNSGHSELFFASMEESIKVFNCHHPQQWHFEPVWGRFDHLVEFYFTDDGDYSDSETLDCLTVWSDMNWNLLPRLRVLDLFLNFRTESTSDDDPVEHDIIRLLYSRRNAPIDWDEETETYTLQPFDPTSGHWQRHNRLECFTISRPEKDFDWENSGLFDEVLHMTRETKDPRIRVNGILHLGW